MLNLFLIPLLAVALLLAPFAVMAKKIKTEPMTLAKIENNNFVL